MLTTVAQIRNAKPTEVRQEKPVSGGASGFRLVIQPSGSKSFAMRPRRPDGRTGKLTLGTVDLNQDETTDEPVLGGALTLRQARQLCNAIDRERARGVDVVAKYRDTKVQKRTAAAERAASTFTACAKQFFADYRIEKRKTRPRRWRDDAALLGLRYPVGSDPSDARAEPKIIKGGLAKRWADKAVSEIDSIQIHEAVDQARKHGGDSRARKMHVVLSAFFSWLKRERRVTVNPVQGVWRPGPPESRERVLTDAEIKVFWEACGAIGNPFGAMFRTLLLTGCRLREVAGMTRAELSDSGVWTIPGTRTKNHKSLVLTMPEFTRGVIGEVPVIEGQAGLVFTTNGTTAVSGFSKAKKALDAAMAKIAGQPAEAWRIHDLRRTAASNLAALGVALPVVEKLLNHMSGSFGGVAGIYQRHEFTAEIADALQRWAVHVEGLVSSKPSNVTPITKRAAP
jgi:integrase